MEVDRRIGSFMRMDQEPMEDQGEGSDGDEAVLAQVREMFQSNLHLPNGQQQVGSPAPSGAPPPPPPPSNSPQGAAPQSEGANTLLPDVLVVLQRIDARLEKVEETQKMQSVRNAVTELNQRQLELCLREKARRHRMNEFTQPMAKYHALDLCDLEHGMEDLLATADLAVPQLAPLFSSAGTDGDNAQVEVDPSTPITVGAVIPVWNHIRTICGLLDDRVHIQQMAGTTSIGYASLYSHVIEHKDGHACFTGSRSDKDYWLKQRLEIEKSVLQKRAHQKQSQNAKGGKLHPATAARKPNSDNITDNKTARQRHNAKNRKAYNARRKAKRALALKAKEEQKQ